MNFFYRNTPDTFAEPAIAPFPASISQPPVIREALDVPSVPATQKQTRTPLVAKWEKVDGKLVCIWVEDDKAGQ